MSDRQQEYSSGSGGPFESHHPPNIDLPPRKLIQDQVRKVFILDQNEGTMGRQKHMPEQIIGELREAEVLQAKGMSMEEVLRWLGTSDATYCKWSKEYGGLRVDHAKRQKELENSEERRVENGELRTD
jgi:hypothetical protein